MDMTQPATSGMALMSQTVTGRQVCVWSLCVPVCEECKSVYVFVQNLTVCAGACVSLRCVCVSVCLYVYVKSTGVQKVCVFLTEYNVSFLRVRQVIIATNMTQEDSIPLSRSLSHTHTQCIHMASEEVMFFFTIAVTVFLVNQSFDITLHMTQITTNITPY